MDKEIRIQFQFTQLSSLHVEIRSLFNLLVYDHNFVNLGFLFLFDYFLSVKLITAFCGY